jgi:hypothetical protein
MVANARINSKMALFRGFLERAEIIVFVRLRVSIVYKMGHISRV